MVTINSRTWRMIEGLTDNDPDTIHDALVEIATEQDRIARQEERERCIDVAQEIVCKMCYEDSAIGCRHANDVASCTTLIRLREAMEGGEG